MLYIYIYITVYACIVTLWFHLSLANELQDISSQFALGFGSFVDKIAYPFSSTLQNGNDYRENHLANMR